MQSEKELQANIKRLEVSTEQALEYCERVEVTKSKKDLEAEIKAMQAKLLAQEKARGATVEEIVLDMQRKQDEYKTARDSINHMNQFIDVRSALFFTLFFVAVDVWYGQHSFVPLLTPHPSTLSTILPIFFTSLLQHMIASQTDSASQNFALARIPESNVSSVCDQFWSLACYPQVFWRAPV